MVYTETASGVAAAGDSTAPAGVTSPVQASQAAATPTFSEHSQPLSPWKPPTIDILAPGGIDQLKDAGFLALSTYGNMLVGILTALKLSSSGYTAVQSIGAAVAVHWAIDKFFPAWADNLTS